MTLSPIIGWERHFGVSIKIFCLIARVQEWIRRVLWVTPVDQSPYIEVKLTHQSTHATQTDSQNDPPIVVSPLPQPILCKHHNLQQGRSCSSNNHRHEVGIMEARKTHGITCVNMTARVIPIGPGNGEVDAEEDGTEGLTPIRASQHMYKCYWLSRSVWRIKCHTCWLRHLINYVHKARAQLWHYIDTYSTLE